MAEALTPSENQVDLIALNSRSASHEKAKLAGEACTQGEFHQAVELYTEAIELDPRNHVLYGNRSAACIRTWQFDQALEDGKNAAELQPLWPKAHYRQGVALQCLGRHAEALAAFSTALAQDDKSPQLLNTLIDAAMKSPLKDTLEPICNQLKTMKLDRSPFVMISVIGQELLSVSHLPAAIGCLEAAVKIGTCGLRLRGSVISALSSAYWKVGNVTKAMEYMKQDLETSQSLGDKAGECRAHGNLGGAYYSQRIYQEASENYRQQLAIAMKIKDRKSSAVALSSLGHVYVAVSDHSNALASHKQASALYKELGERLAEGRELGNIGAVHVLMSQYDQAIHCHQEHLKIAVDLGDKTEEGRAFSNLGSAYHYKRNFNKGVHYHKLVQDIAKSTGDLSMEARAYAGLGHAFRCKGDLDEARAYHERQLEVSVKLKDRATEGRALSNLGIIFQQQGYYAQALKLHKGHLAICKELEDRAGQGRAYGNMGCAYSALARYDQAVKFHKQELLISKEVSDRASEACTHGNLAVAFQAIGSLDKALKHYQQHLIVSQELKDQMNESVALSNLGNFYSSCGEFTKAVPYYDKFLTVARHLKDRVSECKACHNIGFAHYSLGNHSEAVEFYERNITLAKDLDDRSSLSRAHCNIGLAHSALGNYDRALECQREFLIVSHEIEDVKGEFKAHGNIGDIYMTVGSVTLAIQEYEEQLRLAESIGDLSLTGNAYGTLGNAHRTAGELSKALDCHQRELEIRKRGNDSLGTCKALGNLGSDYMGIGRYSDACQRYYEQLNSANDLGDSALESQACGNLGITKLKTGDCHEALGYFEHQLATLEQLPGAFLDSGRAYGNLGECYHMLGDDEEAVMKYEKYLAAAQQAESAFDQDKAYRGLGIAHRAMGNLQQALVCFEKRLVVAHELTDFGSHGTAYGELGNLHKVLGNYEQAIACFEHQRSLAKESGDMENESEALSGLGLVNQKMGEYEKALDYHKEELRIAGDLRNAKRQARAYHNLGVTQEILGNYEQAITYQEQNLTLAAQMGDRVAKTQAYSCLGRTHHALGNYSQAISNLKLGLAIAESLERTEDEARIRHRLGISFLAYKQLDASQDQLYHAADLLERIREEGIRNGDYKISLYDLQAASYQVLQRVLVALGRHKDALAVAERARSRDFIHLLLERQGGTNLGGSLTNTMNNPLGTTEQIMDFVRHQKSSILYYSIAAGHLYSWLITPEQGLVKFHDSLVSDGDNDDDVTVDLEQSTSGAYSHTATLLDSYITHVRDALGVKPHLNVKRATSMTENEIEESWEEGSILGLSSLRSYMSADEDDDAMSVISAPVGRPSSASTPRNNLVSMRGSVGKLNGVRSSGKKHGWSGKPPLRALYELLVAPMEEALPASSSFENEGSELVLVLQGDLYLVPFAVLKGSLSKESLFRRFRLIVVPSLQALYTSQQAALNRDTQNIDPASVLVIGNPKVPHTFGQWASNPSAEHEAKIVAELFNTKPLLGSSATKSEILQRLPNAECVHFATHVSWKLAAVILSPKSSENKLATASTDPGSEGLEFLGDADDAPPLSDFLLTAADVLDQKLSAKLVVIGAAHNDSHSTRNMITSEGLVGLTRALLTAGAQCVLVALWPVPDLACKLLLKAFYGALLRGLKASHALSQAMHIVQRTKQFSHPSNWAGFVLVGGDSVLTSREAMMGHSYALLLNNPKYCREALKVLVHLVEKAKERIRRGERSSMYTAEASINTKVKGVNGWRELLSAVGFRFQKANTGLPDSVFFPSSSSHATERLTKASNALYALLGLSPTTLQALAKLAYASVVNQALVIMLNEVLSCFFNNMANVQVPLKLKLWRTVGCHELLASLGFDLIGVGKEEVMLRSGKLNSRRAIQCTVQALCALTDTTNPADSEEPTFNLLAKSHSSSTVISNTSLMSLSIGSELELKTKSADDLNTINRERREKAGSSTRSRTSAVVRPTRQMHMGSHGSLVRSTDDLQVSSVDPRVRSSSSTLPSLQVQHMDHPSRFRGSHTSLADVSRKSSQRSISSLDISGLQVSSVDEPPPSNPPQLDQPSDSSDVDSYSDITEQQKGVSDEEKMPRQGGGNHVDGRSLIQKTLCSPSSVSSVGNQEDIAKTPGSISSLRARQTPTVNQNGIPLSAQLKTAVPSYRSKDSGKASAPNYPGQIQSTALTNHREPSRTPAVTTAVPTPSEATRSSNTNIDTPNYDAQQKSTQLKTAVVNHHDHVPTQPVVGGGLSKYRSEGNLALGGNEAVSRGRVRTEHKAIVHVANGDVRKPSSQPQSRSVPLQGKRIPNENISMKSSSQNTKVVSHPLSRKEQRRDTDYSGQTDGVANRSNRRMPVNRASNHRERSSIDLSSEDEHVLTDDEYYSKESYANHLRNLSSSSTEHLPEMEPAKSGVSHVIATRVVSHNHANHKGRSLPNMGRSTTSLLKIRTDSLSSQESTSTESPKSRQIAAEQAAAALMQNDTGSPRGGSGSSSSSTLTRQNIVLKDLREGGKDQSKLKRERIANMAHLQSSSC